MKIIRKKIILLGFIFVILLTSGFGCKGHISNLVRKKMQPITLNYWRVWDGPDDFQDIIDAYHAMHPNITINYKKFRYDEYKNALLEGFATDRGPDIFSIHNTGLRKYQKQGMLTPMPAKITMVYPHLEGQFKKEIVYSTKTKNSLTLGQIKNNFADVVYKDVVIKIKDEKTGQFKKQIFALPLSLDTLALFYNRDLFDNAGITRLPKYWNREFQQDVKKLTKQNNKGEIIQSGVALGGSDNIERSTDILSLLMMQNGTKMMNDNGQITFNQIPAAFHERKYNPGLDALRFYSDFANPAKEVYSWNKTLDDSLVLFMQGKLAMMFGYAYMLPDIKTRAPKLNFGIMPMLQIEGNPQKINFANYWVEAVAKKSLHPEEAWDFIQFVASAKQVKKYLDKTKRPTALRSLINEQAKDENIAVFINQNLTAKSWYHGIDAPTAEKDMKEMINQAMVGKDKLTDIITLAAQKIQQTIR